jgi:hypothetical protein
MTVEQLVAMIDAQQAGPRRAPAIMSYDQARETWEAFAPRLARNGIVPLDSVRTFIPEPWKQNLNMALDAQPSLVTEANSAVPAFLTTMIDPKVYEILFAPNRAAEIFGEERKGTWLDETAMFPVVEHGGEVSTYGDYNENGHATANTNWPQRQSYLFQIVKEYGERELERAGLAKISWVSEIDQAASTIMNKFLNLTYFFGVSALQNYGLLNDPNLTAALTPASKAAGGTKWISNGVVVATANEIYNDIQSIYLQLVNQTTGLVEQDTPLVLAMSPSSAVALTQTNSFNVNVFDLLKKNFPNLRLETAVQYGALTSTNPQGVAAGNLVQLIAESVEGQDVGYCAFNEKMRSHPIIRAMSSFRQKATGGTWGAIIRFPAGIAAMVGV